MSPSIPQPAEPLSPERRAEIAARAEAATEGPWALDSDRAEITTPDHDTIVDIWEPTAESRNGEFIAAAREDIEVLLAEIERLNSRVAEVRAATLNEARAAQRKWADALPKELAREADAIREVADELPGLDSAPDTEAGAR